MCWKGLLEIQDVKIMQTRMWANAQPDGHPAEHRWRPLFNAAVWLTPTSGVPCSNAAKTRNPLKFAGVPQTNETISAASGPTFQRVLRIGSVTARHLVVGVSQTLRR